MAELSETDVWKIWATLGLHTAGEKVRNVFGGSEPFEFAALRTLVAFVQLPSNYFLKWWHRLIFCDG